MKLKIVEKSGVDRKRVMWLGGLLGVALLIFIVNRNSSNEGGPSEPAPKARPSAPGGPQAGFETYGARPAGRASTRIEREGMGRILGDFQPSMKPKNVDPTTIDPTLHLDELAKLQNVTADGARRSLFKFSEGPPPEALLAKNEPPKIKIVHDMVGPKPQPPPPPPAPPAPPPAIPLKFYGFVDPKKTGGEKRAFFLDGEDIIVAGEGDMVKKRYKIVHIGVNSAVVEDTQAQNNQQTLPLVQEQNS